MSTLSDTDRKVLERAVQGPTTAKDLVYALDLPYKSSTDKGRYHAEKLVVKGWLEKSQDSLPGAKRAVSYRITDSGRAVLSPVSTVPLPPAQAAE